MKIKIDKSCIGCGSCVSICPECFEMDEKTNKAKPKKCDNEKCAKEAADLCPVNAIKVN